MINLNPAWFFTGWPRALEGTGKHGVTVMQYSVVTGTASRLPHLETPYIDFSWGIRNERANELARSLIGTTYSIDETNSDVVEAVVFNLVEDFPHDGTWACSDIEVRRTADEYMIPWLRDHPVPVPEPPLDPDNWMTPSDWTCEKCDIIGGHTNECEDYE